ncbi:MAG: hypothetical protein FJ280_18485 [Planctomycetes bacterium]|nr:hypothetical protein [Planctomycetota bacterium]
MVLTLVLVLLGQGGRAASSSGDLLSSLVAKNEAAWQKIQSLHSIQYTLERQWLDRQSQQPFQGVARIKKRGNCCWSAYGSTVLTGPLQVVRETERKVGDRSLPMQLLAPDTSAGQTREAERRLVVNDRYAAEWPVGNPLAYRWDHESVDAMSAKTKKHLEMSLPPESSRYCFGDGRRLFREALEADPNWIRFDAVENKGQDGQVLYQIRRFDPKDSPRPDLVWTIDPQKGYLAVENVFYAGRETPLRRYTLRVEEIAPGLWYPTGWEEVNYAEPQQAQEPPAVRNRVKATLKDIKLNEPIADEQFEIEALGLDKDDRNVTVLWTTVEGKTLPYVYREGSLVPRETPRR